MAARQWVSAAPTWAGSANAAWDTAKVAPSASQPTMDSSTGAPASSTVRVAWSGLHGRVMVKSASGSGTVRQFSAGLQPAISRAAAPVNVHFIGALSAESPMLALRRVGGRTFPRNSSPVWGLQGLLARHTGGSGTMWGGAQAPCFFWDGW